MHRIIWPRDVKEAGLWYLSLLRAASRGLTLDELLERLGDDAPGQARPSRRNLQIELYRLQRRGFVAKSGTYNTANYALSDEGLDRLTRLDLRHFKIATDESWDGRWRLVLFDIPEVKRGSRDQVRRLLKELGFRQLQLSAWIHPLPLLTPFQEIQKAYGIEQHLQLLTITDYQPPTEIIKHFARRYPKIIKL